MSIAVAESCTGGLLSSDFVAISGASKWYKGGIIAYNEKVKQELLGVKSIQNYCVSRECAEEMAKGVSKLFGSNIGISTTGFVEIFKPDDTNDAVKDQICHYCIYVAAIDKCYSYVVYPPSNTSMTRNQFREYIVNNVIHTFTSLKE